MVPGTGEEYGGAVGVQYAQHTRLGTEPTSGDTAAWSVRWRAPGGERGDTSITGDSCGHALVHLAANAADGDDSEFGDRIHVDTFRVLRSDP